MAPPRPSLPVNETRNDHFSNNFATVAEENPTTAAGDLPILLKKNMNKFHISTETHSIIRVEVLFDL